MRLYGAVMTHSKTAALNLTDYECRIGSRVIDQFQATRFLPAGTVQWKAELWNKCDDRQVGDSGWEASLGYAWLAAEKMLERLRAALEKEAEEAANVTEMIAVVKPITGCRRLLIQWRLKRQYWAECAAATVGGVS